MISRVCSSQSELFFFFFLLVLLSFFLKKMRMQAGFGVKITTLLRTKETDYPASHTADTNTFSKNEITSKPIIDL